MRPSQPAIVTWSSGLGRLDRTAMKSVFAVETCSSFLRHVSPSGSCLGRRRQSLSNLPA